MISNKGSYALRAGASSGIGHELARLFAKDHTDIVVATRSKDKLEEIKSAFERNHGVKVSVMVKDLADPLSKDMFNEFEVEGVDVLVGFVPSSWTTVYSSITRNVLSFSDAIARGLKAKVSG